MIEVSITLQKDGTRFESILVEIGPHDSYLTMLSSIADPGNYQLFISKKGDIDPIAYQYNYRNEIATMSSLIPSIGEGE